MPLQFKRVVTANSEDGRSYILHDGPPSQIAEQPGRALTFYELWETDGPLASNAGTEDAGARPITHHPPEGGTRFRIVELLPDDVQRAEAVDDDFAAISAPDIQVEGAQDPTMHRNETVDYNIILSGEVIAVTDDAETLLKAGDVLIQRGTAHTWHNRSNAPCVFASVMVSAKSLPMFSK
ncbi:cupin domain-containing protein [Yoonia sp. R2331]|uniref:cupin domain-containing protein n=1 Tax=Yoonia sp. R2331 TaxID=3237238 RepID=UPI0034E43482